MTPENVKKAVSEALGVERAALLEELVAANEIEPGFVYNALLIQLYAMRLTDESKTANAADGRLTISLTAIAKTVDGIASQYHATSGQLDAFDKRLRDNSEIVRRLADQSMRPKRRVSAGSIGLMSLAALVLVTLVCAIVWNLAYQRGARETAYSDAVLSHRNPKIWSRFVHSEIGR